MPDVGSHQTDLRSRPPLIIYRSTGRLDPRQGINLDRSTLADWVGRAAWLLRPVQERLLTVLKGSAKLFADETTRFRPN